MFRKIITLISFLTALCFLAGTALAGMEHKTGPSLVSGLIQHPQLVYTSGPDSPPVLEVSVVLPRGLNCVWTGEAEAWLVVWMTGDTTGQSPLVLTPIQLTGENAANGHSWSQNPRQLITISASEINSLPYGQYQLGIVLTHPNETPTVLGNWYGGFSGLVSVARMTITMGSNENQDSGSEGGTTGVIPY